MSYITSWERRGIEQGRAEGIEKGIEKGREQGREEGREQGANAILTRVLSSRFGELPSTIYSSLTSLNAAQLEELSVYAATAESLPVFQAQLSKLTKADPN